jgi:hypothetical protein
LEVGVGQRVKVYRSGEKGMEVEEVDTEEARKIVWRASAQGRFVIDKKIGKMIQESETRC